MMFWVALIFVTIAICATILAWKCIEEGYDMWRIGRLENRVKALEDMMKGEK